ncbi:MAG: ABC transporter [Propionibacteriaceae bacterium]|jgi:energy-coupling factor transporter ATP-binding protein EcfA2|nr:ABC transporter [Propionibacteriaceae bacterium]
MAISLGDGLEQFQGLLRRTRLAVPTPEAGAIREQITDDLKQLDDYILPRLATIEAPLLAVVGGSTGAGKSTLVNSLLRQVVSRPGVIRPTTKAPVLIHHPDDSTWFSDDRVLPGLARSITESSNPRDLHTVASTALPRGLALLDAPDIDSVDSANRKLASQLLAAADMWLFVTSAARYADAVPWDYLTSAVGRSAAVAVVVDRVPPAAMGPVPKHLAGMMIERGLGSSPLFAVPEVPVDEAGLLPQAAVAPIHAWLTALAGDQRTRARIVMKTLDGAIASLTSQAPRIATAIEHQNNTLAQLRDDAEAIFADIVTTLENKTNDGTLLRGEVLLRWQDYVGAGAFMRNLESRIGRLRDRIGRVLRGEPKAASEVTVAVQSELETLVLEAGERGVARVTQIWEADPAGRHLLEQAGGDPSRVSSDYASQVDNAIRQWQSDVMELVSTAGSGKRTQARVAALGVNAVGVALMLVVFAHTGGLAGAEIGVAGGTAVVAQKMLELIFGDEAIRRLTREATEKLHRRIDAVVIGQRDYLFSRTLDRVAPEEVDPATILDCAADIDAVRSDEVTRLGLPVAATPGLETIVDSTHLPPTATPALPGEKPVGSGDKREPVDGSTPGEADSLGGDEPFVSLEEPGESSPEGTGWSGGRDAAESAAASEAATSDDIEIRNVDARKPGEGASPELSGNAVTTGDEGTDEPVKEW